MLLLNPMYRKRFFGRPPTPYCVGRPNRAAVTRITTKPAQTKMKQSEQTKITKLRSHDFFARWNAPVHGEEWKRCDVSFFVWRFAMRATR
jgi:hypothetical protein